MYGMGNWAEVAEHVGTKNKEACIEHYRNVYLNSPFFPLPVCQALSEAAISASYHIRLYKGILNADHSYLLGHVSCCWEKQKRTSCHGERAG